MAAHNDLGKKGEDIAADFLQREGYTILKRNWQFQKAEIDLIAAKDNVLAIIEVKTRSSVDFGLPQDFVSPKKIRMLAFAVDQYLESLPCEYDVRFDIIAIQKMDGAFAVEHLKDAFYHF